MGRSKGSRKEGIWLNHALTVSRFLRKTREGCQRREPRLERDASRGRHRHRHGTPDEAGRRGQRKRHNPDKKVGWGWEPQAQVESGVSLEMRPLGSRLQQPFRGVGLACFLTSWFSQDAAVCIALNHFKSPYFN